MPNGAVIRVYAGDYRTSEELERPEFTTTLETIDGVVDAVHRTFERVRPNRSKVDFGMNFVLREGKLQTVIADSPQRSAISVTCEWDFEPHDYGGFRPNR